MSMKINEFLSNLNDPHPAHYEIVRKNLAELQPIAFFISMSLLISTFLGSNSDAQQYSVAASVVFFIAYFGLIIYNIIKQSVYLYWSISLLFVGFILLYYSFANAIFRLFEKDINSILATLMLVIIISILYIASLSLYLHTIDYLRITRKYMFIFSFLIIVLFVFFPAFYDITFILLLFVMGFLILNLFLSLFLKNKA